MNHDGSKEKIVINNYPCYDTVGDDDDDD